MVDRVALNALMLRNQLPEPTLREGTSVVARVASRGEAHVERQAITPNR